MWRVRILLIMSIYTCALACSATKNQDETTIDIDLSRPCEENVWGKLVKDAKLVKLTFKDANEVIGVIDRVIFTKSNIIILDKQQMKVFVFDKKGNNIAIIDRQGRDPEQYISIEDIAISDDMIFIYDSDDCKVCIYSINGDFVRKFDVASGYHIAITAYDELFLSSGYAADGYEVSLCDFMGNNIEKLVPVDETLNSLPVEFVNERALSIYEDEVLMTRYFDYSVYSYNGSEIKAKYRFDFGENNFSVELINEKDPILFHKSIIAGRSVHTIDNFVESPDWLIFDAGFKTIFYNKEERKYYVESSYKPAPYGLFFLNPIMGYDQYTDSFYSTVSALNIGEKLIPFLQNTPSGYVGIDQYVDSLISEDENDYILMLRFSDKL
ncbi:MAG: 6-bladed beta-propeller [Marinifilaceae bacterium]|nr:6-bladed beta-propeller [Marinifilaceae bacterium]